MKLGILITFSLVAAMVAFADGEEKKGIPTPWEVLIVKPEVRDNQRIEIDGYLKITSLGDNSYRFQLFMDQDSMKQNRDFRFLEINEQAFLKALTNSGIAGNANILKLHQNFLL